jgi:xylan 1,4-beta-xylosidase
MRHSDNLDGTFTNPVIHADFPDPDIIRVDEDFYMVSSTFHHAPGIPICHSKDLVNWKVIGHAYERLPESNPAYSMREGAVAYRGGSWAPCIRHHGGKFYIGYNTPAEGFHMAIADKPEGPYEITPFHKELYDPGLFFDDDGRVYVFHAAIGIYVTELTSDARAVKSDPVHIYQTAFGHPFEGSHAYKRDGWYYLCVTSRGYNGLQVCLRSRTIHGPYEARVVSGDDMNYSGAGLHQGGFVELENWDTWFFLFQDRDFLGRLPVLQPVTWVDGWPLLGDPDNHFKSVVTARKPAVAGNYPPAAPICGDEFESQKLELQWEWSHNPDDSRWSLTERPGWLRLKASAASDYLHARNSLTQRISGPSSSAVTRLDLSGLKPGDVAGLAVANIPYAFLGASLTEEGIRLRMVDDGKIIAETVLPDSTVIHLRAEAGADGLARFSYSAAGESFTPIGEPFRMLFTVKTFVGNRFALFCFHEGAGECGHADFDYLRREPMRPANLRKASERIFATDYDCEHGTDTHRTVEKQPEQTLVAIDNGDWVQFNQIDFGNGVHRFIANASSSGVEAIELRIDGPNGKLIGRCQIPDTGNRDPWKGEFTESSCAVEPVEGIHALHMSFLGPGLNLMRFESFRFE